MCEHKFALFSIDFDIYKCIYCDVSLTAKELYLLEQVKLYRTLGLI